MLVDWAELSTMELHQTLDVEAGGALTVTKVPGGWIYTHYMYDDKYGNPSCSVFVPYNEGR